MSTDAEATFAMHLDSDMAESAEESADALESLRDEIQGGVAELRNMQGALRNLKGSSAVTADSIQTLRDKIAAHKAIVAQQQARYIGLGGSFRAVTRDTNAGSTATGKATSTLRQLLEAAKGAPGPVGSLASKISAMSKSQMIAAGSAVALGAALAAVAVGATVAIAALAKYGFAAADARRSEALLLEGLSKTRNYWMAAAGFRQVSDSADFLQGTIDQVSDSVALGRDKINAYASSLYRAGLRSGNLQAALEGVSIVAATQGDAAAEAWKGWALGAGIAGQSVRKLADDVKARLGGIAARQLLSLDVQSRKLRENFTRIFSGVRIEKMLEGIGKVTELFSQTTSTGHALKVIAETLLNPIADGVAAVGPIVKDFFRGMVLAAQEIVIHVLNIRLWFKRTFGDSELLKGMNATRLALWAGYITAGLFAGAILAAALGAAAIVISIAALPLALAAAMAAMYALGDAINSVDWEYLANNWKKVGGMIIDGIVGGLKSGTAKALAAVAELGGRMLSAFKRSIDAHSPSKLFFKAGFTAPEGAAGGIRAGRPLVTRAAAELVEAPREQFRRGGRELVPAPEEVARSYEPPRLPVGRDVSAGERRSARSAAPAAPSGPAVVIQNLTVQSPGADAQSQALSVKRELERILKGLAIQLAAPEVP